MQDGERHCSPHLEPNLSSDAFHDDLHYLRDIAKLQRADHIFHEYKVDVIIGSADTALSKIATGGSKKHT